MVDSTRTAIESSPRARRIRPPSWLDLRLVLGVTLVLISVVAGASVLASADRRQTRWALARDLSAGTVLTAGDVTPMRVQLGPADDRYVPVTQAVIGRVVGTSVRSGELLPRSALGVAAPGVAVTIPVRDDNGPTLARGDRITVWLSTKTCHGRVLISGAAVQAVTRSGGGSFGADTGSVLVVSLPAADAARVVAALDLDGVSIRVGVLSSGQPPDQPSTDLSSCGRTGT